MKKPLSSTFFLLLLGLLLASCSRDPIDCITCDSRFVGTQDTIRKVLIIGIDGCRSDALLQANTPNLDALAATGAYHYHVDRGSYTWSAPGWSDILCGVWPAKHGVTFNTFDNKHYDQYPPFTETLSNLWGCINFGSFVHYIALNNQLLTGAGVRVGVKDDEQVTHAALRYIEDCNPDVVFVHLGEVDHIGHLKGFDPSVPEYIAKVEQSDRFAGELIDAVHQREAKYSEDWLIVSVTDHGGTMSGHGGKDDVDVVRYVWMIFNGKHIIPGEILPEPAVVDIVPTIFNYLHISVWYSLPLDGQVVGM